MIYQTTGGRNPILTLNNGITIQTIGDPHLGRYFRNNLKNKLGVREGMVFSSFKQLLNTTSDFCVVVGDLFDKAVISHECLKKTIDILEEVCISNPTKKFVILSGNHDLFKNKSRVSSFEILYNYFNKNLLENLLIIKDKTEVVVVDNVAFLFTEYDPFKTIDEKLFKEDFDRLPDTNFKIAFGHWDTENYGSSKFIDRTIPKILLENCDLIVTGHEHKPCSKVIQNKDIIVTGSLQPYAFNEEVSGENLYITILKEELDSVLSQNTLEFEFSNVKVILNDGEDYPEPFDCLSVCFKHIQKESEEALEDLSKNSLDSFKDNFLKILNKNKTEANKGSIRRIKKAFLEKNYESD